MKHPYYIVSPRYIRTSAGVRVLFKLCDFINKMGGSAYIYLRPHSNQNLSCSPMDVAPFLTPKIAQYHFDNQLTPIVIYPEVVNISKFNAPFKVRYLLNYDQLLFSNQSLDSDDYLIAYSENIADQISTHKPISTIFLPVSDPHFYHPPKISNRKGGVFYAGKFKYHFGGKTFPITDGLPEITRDQPNSQTPEELRELFQTSEFFYCYEDSALALEAMLCGCPTIFLPNEHFQKTLGAKELFGLGYAWGTDPAAIEHAKSTVSKLRDRYFELLQKARIETRRFVQNTQNLVKDQVYDKQFAQGFLRSPTLIEKLLDFTHFMIDNIQDRGLSKTIGIVFKRVKSNRLKLFE